MIYLFFFDLSNDIEDHDAFTPSVTETCREREAGYAISPHSSCTIIQKPAWSVKIKMGIIQIKLKITLINCYTPIVTDMGKNVKGLTIHVHSDHIRESKGEGGIG